MRVQESEEADRCAATYQSLEMARLNTVLKANGVGSTEVRRAICEGYFFEQGVFVDQGWFVEADLRVSPLVAFAERDGSGVIQTLHIPDARVGSMYHEYAHGAAAWLFEDKHEDASEIETGSWAASLAR